MKHYKVVAQNRYGYAHVYATQEPGIIPLIKLCLRVIVCYRWINLTITTIK